MINLDDATIKALTEGEGNPGSILISNGENNANQVNLTNSTISTEINNKGNRENAFPANITINSDDLSLDASQITASTSDNRDAGNITITDTQNINLINNSEISASTSGNGEAGNINLSAPNTIKISGNGFIKVETSGSGDAGSIFIESNEINLTGGIEISASTSNSGNSKDITLEGNLINLDDATITALTTNQGNPGSILISNGENQANQVKIVNNSTISTEIRGQGDRSTAQPANITINSENLSLQSSEITASTNSNRDAGNINLTGNNFNLDNGTIQALTEGEGNPGSILVGNGENKANQVNITNNSTISTEIGGEGDRSTAQPANITINSENLSLQSSEITASTTSNRDAGNINLNNNNINLDNGKITAITSGSGEGGSINIPNSQTLNLINDSEISASTSGSGKAGNLNFNLNQTVNINSGSKLKVETNNSGDAGAITINSPTITIGQDAELSARTRDEGIAGNITLNTNQLNISGELGIFAETEGEGKGGNLIINPQFDNSNLQISFTNNGKISASTLGSGDGGDINITAPFTINIDGNGSIKVETQGEGNAGDIEIVTQNLNLTGGIEITASTLVDENTTISNINRGNAGNIILDANNINLDDSQINAFTNSTGNAGNINFYYREENSDNITLTNSTISTEIRNNGVADEASNIIIKTNNLTADNSTITASTIGVGEAGNITLFTQQLELNNSSKINAFTDGMGSGGSIEISDNGNQNQSVRLTNNSEISTEIKGNGEANQASDITIKTNNLISNDSTITASTQGKGNAGNITIADTQQIELNNSQISTETNGKGNAGQIIIPDTKTLYLDHNSKISTAIADSGIATQPSNIEITARQVFLNNNSQITASTDGQGKAGSINLNIAEDLTLNKNSIIPSAAEENASQDGGNISIKTPEINLNNQSQISVNSDGLIEANAGEINLNSDSITLNNKSQISGSTSAGKGGNINLNAQQLILENGSQIITTTSGKSQAGNINLIIGEEVNIQGENTGILADTTSQSTGKGGNIDLQTPELLIENGAVIAVDSLGEGEGGTITISNQNLNLNQGVISAETTSGDGGDINLIIQEVLTMRNESKISTTAGNDKTGGDGGNIKIFARDIWAIPEEDSDITANAFTGKGGQIFITTETIFGIEPRNKLTLLSDITASSELGVDGIIEITRLNVDPLEGLTNLPETRAEVEVAQGCEVGGEGSIAFYDLGRGGLPAQPTDFLRSKPIPWIRLTTETQQQSWGLTDKTYSVFPATTPIQFKFSCQQF